MADHERDERDQRGDRSGRGDRGDERGPADRRYDDVPPRPSFGEPTSDAIRIIGAETAGAALRGREREPDDGRDVGYPDDGPSWSATAAGERDTGRGRDVGEEPSEPVDAVLEMPHWSEPPTAEMAALGLEPTPPGEEEAGDDAWAAFGAGRARFRQEGADWAEPDFTAFEEGEPSGPAPVVPIDALTAPTSDTDEAFAAEVSRRRGGSRRPATTPREPRPPRRPPREPEHEAAGAGGRDLPTALATAGIVAVVALLAFESGTFATTLLASVIIGLASLEFTNGLRDGGYRPVVPLSLIACATLPLAAREYGPMAIVVYASLVVVFSMLWFLLEVTPGRPIQGVASTMFAFGYVGVLGAYAGLLLAAEHGIGLILGAAICTIAYDVGGFFVGSQFGRSRIAPRISPNKTVEGTVAGMLACVVFGWLVVGRIYPWNGGRGFVLGVLVAAGAFAGDLAESLVKRDLGIKDFGSFLPGHGGVLDRFDSLLVALPITFYLALHLDIWF
jgi:phosphatidate cytidylyltransferase